MNNSQGAQLPSFANKPLEKAYYEIRYVNRLVEKAELWEEVGKVAVGILALMSVPVVGMIVAVLVGRGGL